MINPVINRIKSRLFGPRIENKKFLTIIESPFGVPFDLRTNPSETSEKIKANEEYAIRCARDSYNRGEIPFASHLLYTRFMDDLNKIERRDGIRFGLKIGEAAAERAAVYTDLGISDGMAQGITFWESLGVPVEFRRLF